MNRGASCPAASELAATNPSSAIPSLDVVCQGSPYEMGFSQGSALRSKIEGTLRSLRNLEAFLLEKPAGCSFELFRGQAEERARTVWTALHKDYPEMSRRLDGLAEGSTLGRGPLWLLNALLRREMMLRIVLIGVILGVWLEGKSQFSNTYPMILPLFSTDVISIEVPFTLMRSPIPT